MTGQAPVGCRLDSARFDDLIARLGVEVLYRPATRCACYRKESGTPDPGCTLCFPYGVVWGSPEAITVFGPNRRPTRRPDLAGVYESSDVFFTFQTGFTPVYGARLTLPTQIDVDDLLTRGKEDRVRYPTAHTLLAAWYTRRNPPTGAPYVTDRVELVVGHDVTFDAANGRVTIVNPTVPPAGTRYVVQVRGYTEYFVWETQDRASGGDVMPYRALCKRLDSFLHPRGAEAVSYGAPP